MASSVASPSASPTPTPSAAGRGRKPIYHHLYFWVLVAIVLGALLGWLAPDTGAKMQPLATAFINLIKMLISPIIFCTVVVGIASLGSLSKAGRVGLKALGYFLAATLAALLLGLIVINIVRPGVGIGLVPDPKVGEAQLGAVKQTQGAVDFLLHIIPTTFVGAFTGGEVIQTLLVALLTAAAVSMMGDAGIPVVRAIDTVGRVFFRIIHIVMYAAPIGAFGGMAYTVGKFGPQVLTKLGFLMLCFYATCLLFIFVVLGTVARFSGFSILKFIRLIKDELLIVLGTSSSETVLPRLMAKLENSGAAKPVVGLVVPTGYSFNLDGTCIYLTMGALFIAQATGANLSIGEQIGLLALMLLTSKGAAGVTGAGLVTLAASLTAFGGKINPLGIALIVGIDRFMSEARALTNLIGNGVATMVVAKWEGARDDARFQQVLDNPSLVEDVDIPESFEAPHEQLRPENEVDLRDDRAGGRTATLPR